MDFSLTEEQLALQAMARQFAEEKLKPYAREWDVQSYFPVSVLKEAAQLGMAGITAAEAIGGAHLHKLDAAIILEQLATGCISTATYLSIHNMVTGLIDQYADEALREAYGRRLTSMESMASYCLTEPDAGSDAAALRTRAVRDGNDYIVNGAKAFISGAGNSDIYLCMVRTGDHSYHGITCLLIDKNTRGLSFGDLEKKLGWKSQPTRMVFFENCRVPVAHRVGEEGAGFKIALHGLNGGRINIGACSLGGALACLRYAKSYLLERQQFGKKLADMQALRFYFADMLTEFETARLMVYRAAYALDHGWPDMAMQCAMAKRVASDVAFRISDKAMQIYGGYGYLNDYPIERIFRDLRVHQILEGTNEIMREIIAKNTLTADYLIS